MKDESKRQAYNLIYHSIQQSRSTRHAPTPGPTSSSNSQPQEPNEHARIAAIQKAKQERVVRWYENKKPIESDIFELERDNRRLAKEIAILKSIADAERADQAQKNSWTTWLLSPIYKKAEDNEEEKARKDRQRQERRIEKDMKDRRLDTNNSRLESLETRLKQLKVDFDISNSRDEAAIHNLQARIRMREDMKRQEREKAEREKRAEEMRKWREQLQAEQRRREEREAAELSRQRAATAARQAAERERYEELYGLQSDHTGTCRHEGWWPKIQGRSDCPRCYESWTYLLKCPGCGMKACPRCQAAVRPAWNGWRDARTKRNVPDFDPYDY